MRTFTKNDKTYYEQLTFDELKKYTTKDIERFRNNYYVMLNTAAGIRSYTIGFHFSLFDDEDTELFKDMVYTFKPMSIYCGNKTVQEKAAQAGYNTELWSYFEEGGYIVVLQMPLMYVD